MQLLIFKETELPSDIHSKGMYSEKKRINSGVNFWLYPPTPRRYFYNTEEELIEEILANSQLGQWKPSYLLPLSWASSSQSMTQGSPGVPDTFSGFPWGQMLYRTSPEHHLLLSFPAHKYILEFSGCYMTCSSLTDSVWKQIWKSSVVHLGR